MFRDALTEIFSAAQFNPVLWLALKHEGEPSDRLIRFGQRRVWRWLAVEAAGRHCVSAALLILIISPMFFLSPFWTIAAGWLLIIPILSAYTQEPLWRMRAIVALSFAAVVRLHDGTSALLTAIGIAFGVRLLQIVFIVTLPLQDRLIGTASSLGNTLLGFLSLLNLFVIYFLFYGIYRHLQFRAIRIAQRYAETEP